MTLCWRAAARCAVRRPDHGAAWRCRADGGLRVCGRKREQRRGLPLPVHGHAQPLLPLVRRRQQPVQRPDAAAGAPVPQGIPGLLTQLRQQCQYRVLHRRPRPGRRSRSRRDIFACPGAFWAAGSMRSR